MKLISFDIQSDFGFFRKPETNSTLNVSYNMIHKPAILGLLGAIIGLKGYEEKGVLPEYYQKLNTVNIGIEPLEHECGNYSKTPIKYSNTVGYANRGATFLTEELTLIAPKYRIYLLLDEAILEENQLLENLKNQHSEFIPYFGKNEFTAWWENFKEYEFEKATIPQNEKVKIDSLFTKNQIIRENSEDEFADLDIMDILDEIKESDNPFMYFERLPVDFDLELMQYQLEEMVFTNYKIKNAETLRNMYFLINQNKYVQLL